MAKESNNSGVAEWSNISSATQFKICDVNLQ
jgi:hypothetical protein